MDKGRVKPNTGLNLRQKPNGEKVGVLTHNSSVDILEEITFFRVRSSGGQIGYVHGDYIEKLPSVEAITTTPEANEFPSEHYRQITFTHPCFIGEPVKIDLDFKRALDQVASYAERCQLKIWVTSSARSLNAQLQGAIVPAATKSCHHIGHAIDMNIMFDDKLYNSKKLKKNNLSNLPEPISQFIELIRIDPGLRWGGDFQPEDPVHIDDNFYHNQTLMYKAKLLSRVRQLNT